MAKAVTVDGVRATQHFKKLRTKQGWGVPLKGPDDLYGQAKSDKNDREAVAIACKLFSLVSPDTTPTMAKEYLVACKLGDPVEAERSDEVLGRFNRLVTRYA